MPDSRTHRGADPRDAHLFDPAHLPALRLAVAELSWLLSRGYAEPSSLKLVGDRHRLIDRQRQAVRRSACAEPARLGRRDRCVPARAIAGQPLWIDGFNLLTTLEAALGGAVLFLGRDGALRDLAGVHGTYRRVHETIPALQLLGTWLADHRAGPCTWWLDRPVSNSGRLRDRIQQTAAAAGWSWTVELVPNPDSVLANAPGEVLVVSADSVVLDHCPRWTSLARDLMTSLEPPPWIVGLDVDLP